MPVTFEDNDTLMTAQAASEEESLRFSPLNSSYSYSATMSSLEVVPTKEIGDRQKEILPSSDRNYGSPVGNDINTRHVSGKKIDMKHTQFALSAGMMLGVRNTVGGVNSVSDEADFDETKPIVLEEECARVEKVKIPPGAYFISSQFASLPYRYKFKAYAPHIFSRIREHAGVEKQRFLHSICGNDAFIEFVSNAKSGQVCSTLFTFLSCVHYFGLQFVNYSTVQQYSYDIHLLSQCSKPHLFLSFLAVLLLQPRWPIHDQNTNAGRKELSS